MRFLSIRVENFLSFQEAKLDFTKHEGLIFVKGENRDSCAANGNGSGKSALIVEALLWGLFGKTARGVSGNDVIRRCSNREATIEIKWSQNNATYMVRRMQTDTHGALCFFTADKDLTTTDKRRTQAEIQRVLGFDFPIALYALVLGQKSLSFADATDAEKKRLFETILHFDVLQAAERHIKGKAGTLRTKHAELTSRKDFLDGQLQLKRTQVEEQQLKQADWNAQRKRDLQTIKDSLQLLQELKRMGSLKLHLLAATEEVAKDLQRKHNQYLLWGKELESVREQTEHVTTTTQMVEEMLERTLISGRAATTCPRCGQILPRDLLAKEKQRAKEDKESARGYMKEIKEGHARGIKLSNRQLQLEVVLKTYDPDEYTELNHSQVQITQLKQETEELQSLDREEASCKATYEQTSKLQSPHSEAIQLLEAESAILRGERGAKIIDLAGIQEELEYVEFWVVGFGKKGLQSYLLDSVTPFLTVKANEYAQVLCGGDCQISFQTTAMTKGGAEREDFNISCNYRNGAETYAGQSGGEQDRVNMAIALALQDLVLTRLGTAMNFRVFDESITHTDAEGGSRVMQLLSTLVKEHSTIFFVSHNPEFESYFDKQLKVVKENGISRLE